MPPPQIIGRPSEVEPLLERAGQRAAEVERAAARDIAAAGRGAEASDNGGGGCGGRGGGCAGGGALALLGSGLATAGWLALEAAPYVGAAIGGTAVATVGAAAGIAYRVGEFLLGLEGGPGGGTDSDASRASRAADAQTLNGMQESGAAVWLIMRSRLHKMALFSSHCCRHAISLQLTLFLDLAVLCTHINRIMPKRRLTTSCRARTPLMLPAGPLHLLRLFL